MLAGTTPIDLAALERARIYSVKHSGGLSTKETRSRVENIRRETMQSWQERWSDGTRKAVWTRRVLPDLASWIVSPESRRISFHLTQALSGHGCFNSYLFKRGRVDSPYCICCPGVRDDAEHTIFNCEKYAHKRVQLLAELGRSARSEDIQSLLCGGIDSTGNEVHDQIGGHSEAKRKELFVGMVLAILTDKEEEERTSQRGSGSGRARGRRNEGETGGR